MTNDRPQVLPPNLLGTLWAWRLVLAGFVLVAGVAGFGLEVRKPKLYEGNVRMHMTYANEGSDAPRDPQRRLVDLAARVTSAQVVERTILKLGDGAPSGPDLLRRVSARPSQGIDLIEIHAVDPSPAYAARIANAFAEAFKEVSAETRLTAARDAAAKLDGFQAESQERLTAANNKVNEVRAAIQQQVNDSVPAAPPALRAQALEQRFATDTGYITASAELDAAVSQLKELSGRRQQLTLDAATGGSGVEFVEPARPSNVPVGPKPLRGALIAGVVGLIVGAVAVFWLASNRRPAPAKSTPRPARVPVEDQ